MGSKMGYRGLDFVKMNECAVMNWLWILSIHMQYAMKQILSAWESTLEERHKSQASQAFLGRPEPGTSLGSDFVCPVFVHGKLCYQYFPHVSSQRNTHGMRTVDWGLWL